MQIVEDQPDIKSEFPHFFSNAANVFGFDNANGKASNAGDVFRSEASAYTASVFIEITVQDIVAAIFDGPVASIDSEELLRVGLFRGAAGDAIGYVVGDFPGFLFNIFPFDHKTLLKMGEG